MTAALARGSTTRPPLPQPWASALPLLLGSAASPFEATSQPSKGRRETEDLRPKPLTGKMDKRDFGYNWTHPTEPPRVPYIYKTREQLGARVGGQMSAAITSMRMQPTDGFVALAIPFFAVEWLPD